MMTPNSRSCHSTCWGEGLTSAKFSACTRTDADRQSAITTTALALTFDRVQGTAYRRLFSWVCWRGVSRIPPASFPIFAEPSYARDAQLKSDHRTIVVQFEIQPGWQSLSVCWKLCSHQRE